MEKSRNGKKEGNGKEGEIEGNGEGGVKTAIEKEEEIKKGI